MSYELGDAVGHIKMDSSGVTEGFNAALSVIGQFMANMQSLSGSMQQAETAVNQFSQSMAGNLQNTAGSVTQAMQQTQNALQQTSSTVQTGLAGAAQTASQAMTQAGAAAEQAANAIGENLPAAVDAASESTEGLNDSLGETDETIRQTERQTEQSSKEIQRNMNQNRNSVKGFGDAAKKAADIAKKAFLALTAAITVAFSGALKVGSDFEAAMSQVAATMGTTVDSITELTDIAKEMGAATKFSATQAAEALNYLALAGYSAEKQVKALPTVLNLAAAGGMDLAYASDLVTDSMSALGLSTGQLVNFSDQMAKAAQKSNTSVAQLGEAIIQIGGTAKILSGGTVELNTALGILADNGIKAAEGGTALRQILLNLTAPVDSAREYMQQIGLSAFDAAGNMKPLNQTFSELAAILENATDAERQEALSKIFDARQLKSAEALLANYGSRWDELSGYIENSAGAAAAMAETMNDNLKGAVTIMQSALEGLGITVYGSLELPMKTAVRSATKEIDSLNRSIKDGGLTGSVKKLSEAFAGFVESAADFAANDAIPSIISMFEWIVDNGKTVLNIVTAIGAGFLAWKFGSVFSSLAAHIGAASLSIYKYAARVRTAEKAQKALNATIAANKFAIIGTAIAAVVTAIATAGKDMGEFTKAFQALQAVVAIAAIGMGAYAIATIEAAVANGTYSTSAVLAAVSTTKFVKVLKAAWTVLAAHPIIAVTAAVAALAAALILFRDTEKKVAPEVQAVTDKYKEQQEALDEMKSSYDELRESTEKNKASATDQADKYKELYLRLKDCADAETGRITNLELANSLVAQMNEIYPDSISLIDEQGQMFLDTSKSIDAYVESMRNQALVEAMQPLYQQALLNLSKVKDETEEMNKKWIEAGAAYEEAAFQYNHYISEELATEEQKAKAREAGYSSVKKYLAAQKDVAQEELDNLNQLYVKQKGILSSAEQDVEDYEAKIIKTQKDAETVKEGVYSSELEARKAFYRKQAEQYRQQALDNEQAVLDTAENNLTAMNEKLAALEDKYKKHQLSGDDEYYSERRKIIENANVRELADWWELYDETLESQQKLNDEKLKADKEAADERLSALKESFSKELQTLKTNEKLGLLTESQYYDNLETLLNNYKAKGLDLWEDYGDDIKIARKQINDEITQNDIEAAEKSFGAWSENINAIIDAHKSKYNDILSNQNKLAESLKSYGDLYTMVSEEVKKADGTTETSQKMQLENLDKQLSASELKAYSEKYDKKQAYAEQFAKDFYASEVKSLEDNFANEVRNVLNALPPETKLIGEDSINGFIEGVESKKEDSSAAMTETMNGVIEACRKTLDTHSPSVVFNNIGVNTLEGFEQGLSEKAGDVYATMEQIGANFVTSILKGMQTQWETLKTWFAYAASALTMPGDSFAALAVDTTYTPLWNSKPYNSSATVSETSYKGVTKQDIADAIRETYPNGDVIITVNESELGRISRRALNTAGRQTGKAVIKN